MICPNCGLTDPYRGQGDGIGSCDCPRCDCCRAAPDECYCDQDVEDAELQAELGDDYSCNDPSCPARIARRERAIHG